MNKKANIRTVIGVVLLFSLAIFIFLFSTIGLQQIFSENIIDPVSDGLTPLVSAGTVTTIDSYTAWYDTTWFEYDLFFLLFVIVAMAGTILSAYKERKMGWASFFGYITIGSYIFLLALSFITNLTDWLILNFYYNMFDLSGLDTPIIDFFIDNIHIISFVWFLVIILVNQFDLGTFLKRDSEGGIVEE